MSHIRVVSGLSKFVRSRSYYSEPGALKEPAQHTFLCSARVVLKIVQVVQGSMFALLSPATLALSALFY